MYALSSTRPDSLWLLQFSLLRFAPLRTASHRPYDLPQGPKSTEMLSTVFGADVMESIKFYNFVEVEWHGLKTLIVRAGWSPERGYELYPIPEGDATSPLRKSTANAMWEDLVEAGRPHGVSFGGPHQARRLEGGMLR